jgi:hypothetical protein
VCAHRAQSPEYTDARDLLKSSGRHRRPQLSQGVCRGHLPPPGVGPTA